MQSAAHQEKHFQQYIIDRLVEQGWKLGDSKFYDTERAVYPEDLESWIQNQRPAGKMGQAGTAQRGQNP
jgi:type I restriction enzyme R subunit